MCAGKVTVYLTCAATYYFSKNGQPLVKAHVGLYQLNIILVLVIRVRSNLASVTLTTLPLSELAVNISQILKALPILIPASFNLGNASNAI
jgi:hypothetical protein